MHSTSLVSVVIPAYNAERTILETVESVRKQTFSNFELIVINDGSTDQTLELLHNIKDERLRIFSYENAGVSVARNRGISHANGEFIAFLDADDLWTPDKLELQLTALQQHPEAGVAYSWTRNISEEGKLLHPVEPIYEGNVYAHLLGWNFLSNGSNPLICRKAIESVGEFDSALAPCADWDFYLRLATHWSFVVVPKLQIFYRNSSGAMSSKLEVMKEETLIVLEKAFRAAPLELQALKNQSLANVYLYAVEVYLKYVNSDISKVNQAIQNLWKAVRLQPQNLLNRYTQVLVIKVLLLRVLSSKDC